MNSELLLRPSATLKRAVVWKCNSPLPCPPTTHQLRSSEDSPREATPPPLSPEGPLIIARPHTVPEGSVVGGDGPLEELRLTKYRQTAWFHAAQHTPKGTHDFADPNLDDHGHEEPGALSPVGEDCLPRAGVRKRRRSRRKGGAAISTNVHEGFCDFVHVKFFSLPGTQSPLRR